MTRTRLPSSRGALTVRFSVSDLICAFASPLLAFYFRDAYILSYNAALYFIVSVGFSLIAFLTFRLYDGITRYFSVHDALDVVKAVVSAQLMTTLVLFTFTRLEGIPRSTPFFHALILAAGLIAARTIARAFDNGVKATNGQNHAARENIIMIGGTHLSSLYIKLLEACSPDHRRVIAILDDQPQSIGRSMAGIRILAATQHLESTIDEFIVHGVHTNRIIIGGEADLVTEDVLKEIQRVCERREINLDFVPRLIGLGELPPAPIETTYDSTDFSALNLELPRYFNFKPFFDFFAAQTMIFLFFPLLIIVSLLVLLDVGSPVLFWQQRIGQGGHKFLLHKFRTLRPPFNWYGRPVPEQQRLSAIGRLLRQMRLDELPQLFNVLVGDMSLIGPRPLLPEDQPTNSIARLMVRPGMTGWAQVNGGKFLTPQEKEEFDEFYIRNASPWFDLRILFMTLKVLFRCGVRSDHEVAAACVVGFGKTEDRQPTVAVNHPTARTEKAQAHRREIESPPLDLGTSDISPSIATIPFRKTRNPSR
jgi:lipopolysaccharide/colanic/teichoic acid biosynthesis glycosyltransferase